MKLRRLRARHFRNLPDRDWHFSDGLQIVAGPNEAGKTSIRLAIAVALFTDAASKSQAVVAHRAWGQSDMRLELEFEHDGGVYRLVRDFGEHKNLLAGPDGKESRSAENIREKLAAILMLPTQEAFEATACMSQDELRFSPDAAEKVHALIEKHVLSGAGRDVNKLISKLKDLHGDRHKGETRLVANPGVLKRVTEDIARVNKEWARAHEELAQAEEAASKLANCERALAEVNERIEEVRERLKRHRTWEDFDRESKRHATDQAALTERRNKAEQIERDLAALRLKLDEAAPAAARLEDEARRFGERERLRGEMETARRAAGVLEAQWKAIEACDQAIANSRRELEELPIRPDEAENAFRNLPREIERFETMVAEIERQSQTRIAELEQLEGRLAELQIEVERAEHERETARQALGAAVRRQGHQKARSAVADKIAIIDRLLHVIRVLDERLAELRPEAVTLPDDRARHLHSTVESLRKAVSTSALRLRVEAAPSRTAVGRVDGGAEERLEPGAELSFRETAEVRVEDVVRVVVENRAPVVEELHSREAEWRALLDSLGCGSWDEYAALSERAAAASAELMRLGARREGILAGRTLEQLANEQEILLKERVEIDRALADERPDAGAFTDQIEKILREAEERAATLALEQAGTKAKAETLRLGMADNSGAALVTELERKREALGAILKRAGVSSAEQLAPIMDSFERIERASESAREERSRLLAGRLPGDIERLRAEKEEEVVRLERELDEVPDPAWDAAQAAARAADLERAKAALREIEDTIRNAEADRRAIRVEDLDRRRQELDAKIAETAPVAREYEKYRLDPGELIRLERELDKRESAKTRLTEERGQWKAGCQRMAGLRDQMIALDEEREELERRLEAERFADEVDEHVRELLDQARQNAVAGLREQLPRLTARYLEVATCGRYSRVDGEGLQAAVFSNDKGDALAESELSAGTADQLYLARRLAAVAALFGDKRPPLLMDDVLVHADPPRRAALLRLMREYDGQVLLFTCHNFAEYEGIPMIRLDTEPEAVTATAEKPPRARRAKSVVRSE